MDKWAVSTFGDWDSAATHTRMQVFVWTRDGFWAAGSLSGSKGLSRWGGVGGLWGSGAEQRPGGRGQTSSRCDSQPRPSAPSTRAGAWLLWQVSQGQARPAWFQESPCWPVLARADRESPRGRLTTPTSRGRKQKTPASCRVRRQGSGARLPTGPLLAMWPRATCGFCSSSSSLGLLH